MATQMTRHLMSVLGDLRYEPTVKRIRAKIGAETVVESNRARIIWEPKRVTPSYAVPLEHVLAELAPTTSSPPTETASAAGGARSKILDPRVGFRVRTTGGTELDVLSSAGDREAAAFRPEDPALESYVILDFDAFDSWLEEDEVILGHPRDPFHRVDVRDSSKHVRIVIDGETVAETKHPRLVFETMLPVRFYIPRADVHADVLRPSKTKTICPYKGIASYWSVDAKGVVASDIVWSYEDPLPDAANLRGYLSFYDERVDVIVDRELRTRPVTHFG